jgi:hypothetical protein
VGDALDSVLMASCPTKSEFAMLDVTNPMNGPLVELYRANNKPCALIMLGQGKSHSIALLEKMKSDYFPNGLAHKFVVKAKKANEPSDASAMIKLEVELDKLQLKGARDFYNDVVRVLDKFKVTKTDQELCMLMAWKNHDTSYARLILDKLKSSSPDFDGLCNSISEIRRLKKVGVRGVPVKRRCILLPLRAMECSRENAGTAAKYGGTRPWAEINVKGSCTVVVVTAKKGAIQARTRSAISVA